MRMATSSSTRRVRQSGADLKPPVGEKGIALAPDKQDRSDPFAFAVVQYELILIGRGKRSDDLLGIARTLHGEVLTAIDADHVAPSQRSAHEPRGNLFLSFNAAHFKSPPTTLATVIASQSIISGAYSLIQHQEGNDARQQEQEPAGEAPRRSASRYQ